ncbi:uncharacterized protein LOC100551546 [Anolis carolinensis]|uniref:uncharacterized protein LOC100551546 n=1 Tax=Anolis carolinensis TaxID=28377 RepID=UPI00020399CF|nr:PREDICTED: early nodulin-75-like [Anolis carolinensis]XP_016850101.1 PREDICTED: early nodulin-75-like [Anolis carolinensis]|eukprot:XP_016850100.1 PREDICTED: early nodulin-75-like [Anolis carolinensis]
MAWSCCKEKKPPEFSPKVVEEPKFPSHPKPPVIPVAYVLKHEEDEDEYEPENKSPPIKPPVKEKPPIQVQVQVQVQEVKQQQIEPSGEDDDLQKPSTSEEKDTRETQTNPHHFPKSPGRVTLDEILHGMQRIQFIMDNTVTDFEQRISRLERIVLKMRNAWIHHRTCHLEGLEYDDEHED